jgi:hypothetical protein
MKWPVSASKFSVALEFQASDVREMSTFFRISINLSYISLASAGTRHSLTAVLEGGVHD